MVKGTDGGVSYTVAIATEITHHEHFMTSFRQTLWGFMSLATLAMGLLGWFVVRRGLLPLLAIKRQAAEITANRLHTRLPVEAIPRELADLADTLNGMLSRLEESFQRLSDFSSDLAHELRTPITVILAECDRAKRKAYTRDDFLESVGVLNEPSDAGLVLRDAADDAAIQEFLAAMAQHKHLARETDPPLL